MKIVVNGSPEEIKIVEGGIEVTADILGNEDALVRDNGDYTMSKEDFDWWVPVADKLNRVYELESRLDDSERDAYNNEDTDSIDFEDSVDNRLEVLNRLLKVNPEAEAVAAEIRSSDEWNPDLLKRLCSLADMDAEWEASDGETFEKVAFEAAKKLGVELL